MLWGISLRAFSPDEPFRFEIELLEYCFAAWQNLFSLLFSTLFSNLQANARKNRTYREQEILAEWKREYIRTILLRAVLYMTITYVHEENMCICYIKWWTLSWTNVKIENKYTNSFCRFFGCYTSHCSNNLEPYIRQYLFLNWPGWQYFIGLTNIYTMTRNLHKVHEKSLKSWKRIRQKRSKEIGFLGVVRFSGT